MDGSTSGVLTYGSEIIVYAELLLYSAFQARIQKIIETKFETKVFDTMNYT